MQSNQVVARFTNISKLWKMNVLLLIMVILGGSLAISYAGNPDALNGGKCGAKIALVLDRSASIGVSKWNGNQDNVNAVKFGSGVLTTSMMGPDAFTDVYAFASDAQRINSGWLNLVDQNHVNLQNAAIAQIPFKTGADNESSGDLYPDGLVAGSEALTNWEAAIRLPLVSHANTAADPMPDAIILFTDGEPTTNLRETDLARGNGGRYTGLNINNGGYPGVDGVDEDDLSAGYTMAAYARSLNVRVIPVAIGDYSGANLQNMQKLAGPETLYKSNNISDLANLLKAAVADVCKGGDTRLAVSVQEKTGPGTYKKIALPITLDGAMTGSITSTGNDATPWATRNFDVTGNWDLRQRLQLPAGYHAVAERCERDKWNGQAPFIAEVEESAGVNAHILMRGQAPGGTTYCEYVVEKDVVTPTSTLRIIATDKDTAAVLPAKFDYVDSPFAGPQFETTAGGSWSTKTAQPTTPWGFKTSWVAGSTPGYTFDSVYCRTGDWASSSPTTGTPKPAGIDSSAGGYAPGTTVSCEYKFKKIPVDSIKLDKTVNPTTAKPGQTVTYSFVVTNTGTSTLKNVKISDPMLGGQVGSTIASLAPGASAPVVTKDYKIPADAKDVIHNVASATGTPTEADGTTRPDVTATDPADVTIVASPINPKIELTKSGPATAKAGDKVTFTFKVKNIGDVDLTNIVITDETLSKYLDKPVSIKIDGTLKVGATSDIKTLDFTIPKDYKETTFKNVAVVKANPINPDTGTTITTTTVTDDDDHIINLIKWTTTKTADKEVVVAGDTVTYTISVTNNGATTLTNVEVSDPTINFPADGKPVVIAEIKPGETKSLTATYVVPKDYKEKTFKNVALVCVPTVTPASDGKEAVTTKDCQKPEETIKIIKIDIVKTADKEQALPGEKVIYKFVVTNTGGADIDPTPINDDVLGVIGDPGVLKPGESATFTKEYTVPTTAKVGDKIINVATVCASTSNDVKQVKDTDCVTTCPTASTTTVCDQDTHTLLVVIPKITIVKTADKTTSAPGETVNYTFVVTNTGNIELVNIKVTDNVLGDLGTIEKLAPGASVTKTKAYVVPATATGTIRNVATACFETPKVTDSCASDDHVLTIVAVAGEVVTRPAATNLPFTGASSVWMAVVASLMLASGIVIFLLTRKKRTA